MQLPIKIESNDKNSLQDQVCDQIRRLILGGQLNPGIRLPSSRELSEQLSVSRNTIINAYEHLVSEGYLTAKLATGTFVSRNTPESALTLNSEIHGHSNQASSKPKRSPLSFKADSPGLFRPKNLKLQYDFIPGAPDPQLFPTKTWRRLANIRLSYAAQSMSQYGDPAGLSELRGAIANYLGPSRGIIAAPEQVIITAGCQQALNIISHLFLKPDSEVIVEAPCYRGARHIFETHGAILTAIPIDKQGINVSHFPEKSVRLIYVTPSHQSSLGATLSHQRREELISWASRYGAYVVEDDFDGDFRYEGSPLPALQALDSTNSVLHIGSFSKSIGAGLRLGYIVVPPELVKPAIAIKALLDNGSPWLEQAVLADFIQQGSFNNHLKCIRHTYMIRRDCLITTLQEHFGQISLSGIEGGTHVAWYLPDHFPPAHELQNIMRLHNVGIYSLKDSFIGEYSHLANIDRTILLGYAALTENKIRKGIARIAEIIDTLT